MPEPTGSSPFTRMKERVMTMKKERSPRSASIGTTPQGYYPFPTGTDHFPGCWPTGASASFWLTSIKASAISLPGKPTRSFRIKEKRSVLKCSGTLAGYHGIDGDRSCTEVNEL